MHWEILCLVFHQINDDITNTVLSDIVHICSRSFENEHYAAIKTNATPTCAPWPRVRHENSAHSLTQEDGHHHFLLSRSREPNFQDSRHLGLVMPE